VDQRGQTVEPDQSNAVKFETFIFDALPRASASVVLEVDRREQFSPIKNAEGPDSPATARRDLISQAARMMEQAQVKVPRGADGQPVFKIEISPLFAMDAEELAARLPYGFEIERDLLLE
jgi:UDP-N-acetylglucosamine/UDP-N-acetylgalactosamine diphosphorylase